MYYDTTNNCKLPKSFEFPQTEQSFGFVCSVLVCFSLENLFKNAEMVIGSKNIEKKSKCCNKEYKNSQVIFCKLLHEYT